MIPSLVWLSETVKSFITHSIDWHTMSFKSLATVVVMSRTLELPKLRWLILPALLVDRIEALAPNSPPSSL